MTKAAFRQVDVTRLIRGALKAGLPVDGFKIVVDNGRPCLLPVKPGDGSAEIGEARVNTWADVLDSAT